MRNWIIGTLIAGAICFYIADLATKEVKEINIFNQKVVTDYVQSVNDLIKSELNK